MDPLWAALLAGFIATILLSIAVQTKQAMGIMPRLEMVGLLHRATAQPRPVDWFIHFLIGTAIYGISVFILSAFLRVDPWFTGAIVGAIWWLVAMVALMPAAGMGIFGSRLGAMAPVMALMMHLLFGAAVGLLYGWLA